MTRTTPYDSNCFDSSRATETFFTFGAGDEFQAVGRGPESKQLWGVIQASLENHGLEFCLRELALIICGDATSRLLLRIEDSIVLIVLTRSNENKLSFFAARPAVAIHSHEHVGDDVVRNRPRAISVALQTKF